MTFLLVANLTLFSVAVLVGVLQKAHERYVRRPHPPPLGADGRIDADLQRVLHDLDARA